MKKILCFTILILIIKFGVNIDGYSNITKKQKLVFSQSGTAYFDTESFKLKEGTAIMHVSVYNENSDKSGSYSAFDLCKIEKGKSICYGIIGNQISIKTKIGESKKSGKTTIRYLKNGTYYVKVISGINWTVKIYQ